jgi:hypothetical protein
MLKSAVLPPNSMDKTKSGARNQRVTDKKRASHLGARALALGWKAIERHTAAAYRRSPS